MRLAFRSAGAFRYSGQGKELTSKLTVRALNMSEAREILAQFGAMRQDLGRLQGSSDALIDGAQQRDYGDWIQRNGVGLIQ